MKKLTRADLWSLEEYAEKRATHRTEVIAHKKNRQVSLGEHARLCFEDEITIRYQIQEMLRAEKVFEAAGIQEELDAYNPLIGDGQNLKATLMIEYDDPAERAVKLAQLIGVEDQVWVKAGDGEKSYAIADEDIDRENDVKTSAVHFLRFELDGTMIGALKNGAPLALGIDHPNYLIAGQTVAENVRESLVSDLEEDAPV